MWGPDSVARLRLLGAPLLDLLDLVDEMVGLLLQAGTLSGGLAHISLAAIEEVQVGHGVVVIGLDLNGFLQVGDTFFHQGAILCSVLRANCRWERIVIPHLLIDVIPVVSGAQLAVGTEGEGPIDDADPVISLGISGLLLDVLLLVELGFLKFLGIVGSAGHLEEDGTDAIDGTSILFIDGENVLESS